MTTVMGNLSECYTAEGFCVNNIYDPVHSSWFNQDTMSHGYLWFDETGDGNYHFVPKKYYYKAVRLVEVIHFRKGVIEGIQEINQTETIKNMGFVLMKEDLK